MTRYEILRGLKAKDAFRQIERFEERCGESVVFPLSDEIVVRAAEIYGALHTSFQSRSQALRMTLRDFRIILRSSEWL